MAVYHIIPGLLWVSPSKDRPQIGNDPRRSIEADDGNGMERLQTNLERERERERERDQWKGREGGGMERERDNIL